MAATREKFSAARRARHLRLSAQSLFTSSQASLLCDVQRIVRSRGLEIALRELREGGVYITFEEFKGRQPIVWNGKVIPVKAADFDDPRLSYYY